MSDRSTSSEVSALDVIVELVPELEEGFGIAGTRFFDRLCEAVCELVGLERAGLLLYDEARRVVVPVGSHGIDSELLSRIYGTLDETPIAQQALAEDRVVEATEDLERLVPARYGGLSGITTVVCTPVSAAGRWLGVIFADRGGQPFRLGDHERRTLFAFGKAAALAASTRLGMAQQVRARALSSHLDLARELHERVVQRLFGVSLVLGSEHRLSDEERERCAAEIEEALSDMRAALSRPFSPPPLDIGATLREEVERLRRHYAEMPIEVEWEAGAEVPDDCEPLTQAVLAEALRNCEKHAQPSWVRVRVGRREGTFFLEVHNDGRGGVEAAKGSRMGLHIAALEAIQKGGMVEFGPLADDEWRLRLVLPEAATAGGEE